MTGNPDLQSANERAGISDVLPCMNRLILDLEDKAKDTTDPQLLRGIQAGLKKANHYYHILCQTKPYVVATFLDPRRNGNWFYHHAFPNDQKMKESVWKIVSDVFQEWYERLGKTQDERTLTSYSHATWPLPPSTAATQTSASSQRYEFEMYLKSPLIKHYVDLFKFWEEKEKIWPTWAAIAFAFLSIPTMSAEVERVFSRYCLQMNFADVAQNKL